MAIFRHTENGMADVALVVWHGISVTYLWGPLCGGREGGVFVGGDALE